MSQVQANMGIYEKDLERGKGAARHLGQSIALLRSAELDLLVWPESAYTFFIDEEERNLAAYDIKLV